MKPNRPDRRRLMLGAFLAPAVAALPARADAGADAQLLELGRQYDAAKAEAERASALSMAAHEKAAAHYPKPPATLLQRRDDYFTSWPHSADKPFDGRQVGQWRAFLDGSHPVWSSPERHARMKARAAEIVQAWDTFHAAHETVFAAFRCRAFDTAANQRWERVFALESQIFAIRATTPAGWCVKARIASHVLDEPDGSYEDALVRNLLDDITGGRTARTAALG